MAKFSGLPTAASWFFFALFCAVSALQFPFFFWFARAFKSWGFPLLSSALGWVVAEQIFFRIFPWTPAHALLEFHHLTQIASIVSASGLTALMFILGGLLISPSKRGLNLALFAAILGSVLVFGELRLRESNNQSSAITVGLVQGNISVEEKHSRAMVYRNVNTYLELSRELALNPAVDLVIWPETVLLDPIPIETETIEKLALPYATLLFGSLSYRGADQFFNSAFAIAPLTGITQPPYHKRILMPFGEYTPGIETFPFLKSLNENAAEFNAGTTQTLVTVPSRVGTIKAAPLICYEDVVTGPAFEATRQGANLLVNMTNDGWFGVSAAAKQHHQIAAWRTLETGLPLIRVTNTGLTAVVNRFGLTIASIPEHIPGTDKVLVKVGGGSVQLPAEIAIKTMKIFAYLALIAGIVAWLAERRRAPNSER
jgi:apolipoprotein N-acyltransferase